MFIFLAFSRVWKKNLGGLAIFFTETNTNPGDDVGIGNTLMKSTGGRVGDFLFLGMKGGVWKKTRFGTAMVVEKYWNPPLLCVCWVLAIEWKCVWNVKVCGCRCTFEWEIGSNGSWAGGMGPTLGV